MTGDKNLKIEHTIEQINIELSCHLLIVSHCPIFPQATSAAPGYTCNCNAGWQGTNCDQNVNECASNPCQNGGTCNDGLNGFTCTCTDQWTGPLCQTAQQGRKQTGTQTACMAVWARETL